MGRSITARTARRLDALEIERRDCRCGNGICRSRATVRLYYNRPDQPLRACKRHAAITAASPISDHLGQLTLTRVETF